MANWLFGPRKRSESQESGLKLFLSVLDHAPQFLTLDTHLIGCNEEEDEPFHQDDGASDARLA